MELTFFDESKDECTRELKFESWHELAIAMNLCMVQFYLLPFPPGQPPGQVQPFGPKGPGVGNCLKRFCPGVGGRGKSKITSRFSCDARHL